MVFSLWLWQTTTSMATKTTHQMLAISIAMQISGAMLGALPNGVHQWLMQSH
jgi:hypothetical protein